MNTTRYKSKHIATIQRLVLILFSYVISCCDRIACKTTILTKIKLKKKIYLQYLIKTFKYFFYFTCIYKRGPLSRICCGPALYTGGQRETETIPQLLVQEYVPRANRPNKRPCFQGREQLS